MKVTIERIALWLVLIGALNWGLVALGFNLVSWITNLIMLPVLANVIYILIGISAIIVFIKER